MILNWKSSPLGFHARVQVKWKGEIEIRQHGLVQIQDELKRQIDCRVSDKLEVTIVDSVGAHYGGGFAKILPGWFPYPPEEPAWDPEAHYAMPKCRWFEEYLFELSLKGIQVFEAAL